MIPEELVEKLIDKLGPSMKDVILKAVSMHNNDLAYKDNHKLGIVISKDGVSSKLAIGPLGKEEELGVITISNEKEIWDWMAEWLIGDSLTRLVDPDGSIGRKYWVERVDNDFSSEKDSKLPWIKIRNDEH